MTRVNQLRPEFVEHVPDELEDGVLYVSMPLATAIHACCCGCGREVVTPLSPTDWELTYNGEVVSLDPSIGNWSFDCQSHYWIEQSKVRWSRKWTRQEVQAGRDRDRKMKTAAFFEGGLSELNSETTTRRDESWGQKVSRWFGRRTS